MFQAQFEFGLVIVYHHEIIVQSDGKWLVHVGHTGLLFDRCENSEDF